VKLLRRELLIDRMHVERFLREVRAASALDSPNVVRVLEASGPDDPVPFLAMEKARRRHAERPTSRRCTLDRGLVLELVTQLGAVLELARAAGMVAPRYQAAEHLPYAERRVEAARFRRRRARR